MDDFCRKFDSCMGCFSGAIYPIFCWPVTTMGDGYSRLKGVVCTCLLCQPLQPTLNRNLECWRFTHLPLQDLMQFTAVEQEEHCCPDQVAACGWLLCWPLSCFITTACDCATLAGNCCFCPPPCALPNVRARNQLERAATCCVANQWIVEMNPEMLES